MATPITPLESSYSLVGADHHRQRYFSDASWWSQLYFLWLQPLISLGYSRPLEESDQLRMPPHDCCAALANRYRPNPSRLLSAYMGGLFTIAKDWYWRGFLSYVVYLFGIGVQPFLVQALLDYLADQPNGISNHGGVLVAFLFLASFLAVSALESGFYSLTYAGINVRSVTMDLLYAKAMKLPANLSNRGEIVTLMSIDAQRVFEACRLCPWVVIGPIVFVLTQVLIALFFDPLTSLAGFAVLIGMICLSFYFGQVISKARTLLVKVTEERLRLTSEVLQGIRVIKLYGWEDALYERIEAIRKQEVKYLRQMHTWKVINRAFLFVSPIILSGSMLTVYISLGHSIDVAKAFTLLACMNISRMSFVIFPQAVAMLSEALVSVNRIKAYLDYEEVNGYLEPAPQDASPCIKLEHCSFTFPKKVDEEISNSFKLQNINLNLEIGSLTIVVGSVGSGKSSLINGILREMVLSEGSMDVQGDTAYVGQEPWIRNTTIRENILFEEEFDKEWYNTVLDVSQLRPDLKIMAAGDQTEIGEQGMNLSGGQKARVSLARAFYCSRHKDILLLDDVLSAVDAHVASELFKKGIKGLTKKKTTILVMNSHYQFLSEADRILVMSNGEIIGDGSFEVIKQMDEFKHIVAASNDPKEETEEEKIHEAEIVEKMSDLSRLSNTEGTDGLIEKEDRLKGGVTFYTYISYFQLSGLNGWVVFFILVTLYGCGQTFRTLTDLWHGQWSDNEQLNPGKETLHDGLVFLVLILSSITFVVSSVVTFIYIGLRCTHKLHNLAFRKILAAPVNTFFDVTPVGRIMNRLSFDMDSVDSQLQDFGTQSIQEYFQVIAVLLMCVIASWYILLSYIPMFVIFYFIGKYFLKSSTEIKRLDNITKSPIFSSFADTLNGVQTIRAFQMQEKFRNSNRESIDKNTSFFFTFLCSGYWLAIRLDVLSVVLIAIVSIVLVLTKGQVDPSIAGITLVYSLSVTSMLQWCVRLWNLTESSMTSVERLLHYQTIKSEATAEAVETTTISNWPSKGNIEFQDLSMRYRPGLKLVLKGINVSIYGGQKIGICGRTGAGKSSLMTALFRIAEFDQGTILIDGVDISNIDLKELRQNISIIPQDPVLFSGSLRYNLDPFSTATDEALEDALRRVHLWDFVIHSLNGDLDYELSERGENLSLGQRQLVCIARAILRRNRIIVMDEATASVDIATDALIQTTIREVFTKQTILTIAHRLETILDSDKILLLDDGRVAEYGEPQALLQNPNGLFRALAQDARLQV